MAQYRKRPAVVEAEQYTEAHLPAGVCMACLVGVPGAEIQRDVPHVHTAQGIRVTVRPGEWIVAEPDGRGHYPVAQDLFERMYFTASEPEGLENEITQAEFDGNDMECVRAALGLPPNPHLHLHTDSVPR